MRGWAAVFAAILLTACAAPLKDPWGLAVSHGLHAEAPPLPDSLQADIGIQPREAGTFPFTARLYAKPQQAYRLDAFGFPALIAASYLWIDGRWMLVRHDQKEVREGSGNELEIEGSSLRLPDVHAVLGFLWGRPLPGFEERDSVSRVDSGGQAQGQAQGQVRWVYRGENWEATFDPVTGLCREVRSPSLTIRYGLYQRRGARVLPGEAEILVEGTPLLTLRLRELMVAPLWKKNPFVLNAPSTYKHL